MTKRRTTATTSLLLLLILLLSTMTTQSVPAAAPVPLAETTTSAAFVGTIPKTRKRSSNSGCGGVHGRTTPVSLSSSSNDSNNYDSKDGQPPRQKDVESRTTKTTSVTTLSEAERLRLEARRLREEVASMRQSLIDEVLDKREQHTRDVDRWLDQLLVNETYGTIEKLNTVEHVAFLMVHHRYSPDHIYDMFDRLCEICPIRGRDSVESTPLLKLLLEAAGILDDMERAQNPNKRWDLYGRVENTLRKKLFAMEWGMDYDHVTAQQREKKFRDGLR